MKNKTKLMLALSILTAGTLAAGATGTFAWFTTNKTATATYNKITVQGTQGSLKVSIKGVTDQTATGEEGYNSIATAEGSMMSDVSSKDGLEFKQPDWVGAAGNTKEVRSLLDVSNKKGYFVQYEVTVKNDGDGEINLYLAGTSITSSNNNSSAASWTRVALITNVSGNNGFLSNAGKEEAATSYLFQTEKGEGKNQYTNSLNADGKTLKLENCSNLYECGTYASDTITLGKLSATEGNSITFGVSVWLEGTMNGDKEQDAAKDGVINVALTFSSVAVLKA